MKDLVQKLSTILPLALGLMVTPAVQASSDADCTKTASLQYQVALELTKKPIVDASLTKAVEKVLADANNSPGGYYDWFARSYASFQLEHMTAKQFHNAVYRDCMMAGLSGAARRKMESDPKIRRLSGPQLVDASLHDLRRQRFPYPE